MSTNGISRFFWVASLCACSTIGTPTSSSEGFPHGGVGLFRDMCVAETNQGIGFALTSQTSLESGMLAGEYFFYGAAPTPRPPVIDAGVADASEAGISDASVDAALDAGRDANVVDANTTDVAIVDAGVDAARSTNIGRHIDWSRFDPRQIYRAQRMPREYGAREGSVILSSSLPWEGGYVTDPWALQDGNRTLLYYAAAGGIGVATGTSLGGSFQKENTPIFPAGRHPSVVNVRGLGLFAKDYVMFFEINQRVAFALSSDGIHFDPPQDTPLAALAPRDSRDGQEIGRGAPGALVVRTDAGRNMVRVYYESRRSNGLVVTAFAATANGSDYDVLWRPVFSYPRSNDSYGNRYAPAPYSYNGRITLLYTVGVGANGKGTLLGSLTPDSAQIGVESCGMTL